MFSGNMPPETTGHPIELTDRTCRLCLANDQDISPMVDALSQDEQKNIIEGLLKIEVTFVDALWRECLRANFHCFPWDYSLPNAVRSKALAPIVW